MNQDIRLFGAIAIRAAYLVITNPNLPQDLTAYSGGGTVVRRWGSL